MSEYAIKWLVGQSADLGPHPAGPPCAGPSYPGVGPAQQGFTRSMLV